MNYHKYILIVIIFLILFSCQKEKGSNIWVYKSGNEFTISQPITIEKKNLPKMESNGNWKLLDIGPWKINSEIIYSILSKRLRYKISVNGYWVVEDGLRFANLVDNRKRTQKKIIEPILHTTVYDYMKIYEVMLNEEKIDDTQEALKKFLEENLYNDIDKKKIGKLDIRFLEFMGTTFRDIVISIEKING